MMRETRQEVFEKMARTKLVTAEELFEMPQDDRKSELVKGELIYMAPTGGIHGVLSMRLGRILDLYVVQNNLGLVCAAETGFTLKHEPDTVRAPDVSFISKEKLGEAGIPDKYWNFAPDLAVEVLSPSERAGEVITKVNEYLRAGTRMVWVINPKSKTVMVYRSDGNVRRLTLEDELDGEDVVPGFQCPINKIFLGEE